MTKFYLAYGSNLNQKQMKIRCPQASFIGTTNLENYKLTYRDNGDGRGVMNIEICKGNKIPVGIYSITEGDEKELDWYEGFPSLYRKELVQVVLNNEKVEVMVYVMNEEGHPYAQPTERYYNTIYQGYKDCGFDTKYLKEVTELNKQNIEKGE
ncbi:MAG: gamma-glutamylcyclotransferase [Elusimicrobia bacterium]|nr:gamma-glutamylcyclotransferase [Elusimicrobiota bacterium]